MNAIFPVTARAWLILVHDAAASLMAWYVAHGLFFNLNLSVSLAAGIAQGVLWVVPLQVGVFLAAGLPRDVWRHAGVPDLRRLLGATLLAVLILLVPVFSGKLTLPIAILPLDALLLLFFLGAGRVVRHAWPQPAATSARPALLVGGGQADHLLRMLPGLLPELRIVGLLDDDPALRGCRVWGVPVLGRCDQLVTVAAGKRVRDVVLATADFPREIRERLARDCEAAQICLHPLPTAKDFQHPGAPVTEVGRSPCGLPASPEVLAYLHDRVVLVMGCGGLAWGELCGQIAHCQPARLLLFDANEQALLGLQQELAAAFPELPITGLLGQVMDRARVDQVMADYAPSLVLHAANYRLPLPQQDNTFQSLRYNVLGTWVVAKAARSAGVEKFVLLSGDGEGVPGNVVAASQRLAEMLCQALHAHALASAVRARKTAFVTLRLGEATPVSVDPETVRQVLRAAVLGHGGECFLLHRGGDAAAADLHLLPSREVDADTMALMLDWLSHHEVGEDAAVHDRLAAWLPGYRTEPVSPA